MSGESAGERRDRHREAGFGLIEAMIALLVFIIGIMGALSMQATADKSNDFARGLTEQSTLAAALLEELMTLPYDDANLASGSHSQPSQGRYTINYTVTDDMPITNTKTLTVTVSWTDRGNTKSVNFTELKANAV